MACRCYQSTPAATWVVRASCSDQKWPELRRKQNCHALITLEYFTDIIQHFAAMIKFSQPEHFVNHNQSLQLSSYCFAWHEK